MSEIAKWYTGKNVFITGATGLVGKCLVEKLLRDCPNIGSIYIMLRAKKGMSSAQRAEDYKNHVVFSKIKQNEPKILDKIRFVEGDLLAPKLGISDTNRKLIAQNVSVIFHVAASVQFDQTLAEAYRTNVGGTKAALEFATEFKQVDVFEYMSTAFSQPLDVGKLEEKYYPSSFDPEQLDYIMNNIDPNVIEALTPKILGKYPNTYAFSKSICEQLVYNYKDKFPTAIARPSIIASSWMEPLPGYTEGIHGLNGWFIATGRGVLRSMLCHEDYPCNAQPNDIVVNGAIVLAYERAKQCQKLPLNKSIEKTCSDPKQPIDNNNNEPLYFNIVEENPLSWKQYIYILKPYCLKKPLNWSLWFPGGSFKTNRFYNFISVLLFQLLPAILIDTLLVLFRAKPILLRVQRKIASGVAGIEYYANNIFRFKATVYNDCYAKLNDIDKKIFYDRSTFDTFNAFENGILGTRYFLLKEKPEDLPRARIVARFLWCLDILTKTGIYYWMAKKVFNGFLLWMQ